MDAYDFVRRWRSSTLREAQAYQTHFEDLCRLAGHPTPTEADPHQCTFGYQKSVRKFSGRQGWADVWYEGHFAIEYKSKGGDLDAAYAQLLQYRDNLDNPPLLIVCDFDRIIVRTNYTGRTTRRITLLLDDFLTTRPIGDTGLPAIEILRRCFYEPESLVPEKTTARLTEEVAEVFKDVAESLRKQWGHGDMAVASYLSKLVFCMFASDVGLLPHDIITTIIDNNRGTTGQFASALSQLFAVMNTGGQYGPHQIAHFNGGLFRDPVALAIDYDNLMALRKADQADWADVEPSVFGTLFERIIDEKKRSQLGKHYTSREDIETLIEPVLMTPLRRDWNAVADEVDRLMAPDPDNEANAARAHDLLDAFVRRLAAVTVLDPACGSGNFLYVALEKLKLMERDAITRAGTWGIRAPQPRVHPQQLHGIEVNEYAHELASIVVWIGYLQWKKRNGFSLVDETPILQPLDNIHHMDAVLQRTAAGRPFAPEWPDARFIVGNPPFVGGKRLRTQLGADYVDALFDVWDGKVKREADFCCYWFERAREMVAMGKTERVGLLATQAIRGGANRDSLERIKRSGDIFFAESDRPWILDGAAVRVSMVGFDNGSETERVLDGLPVEGINANLTGQLDLTKARPLKENRGICFRGNTKVGAFELTEAQAKSMLGLPNPHGRPNSEVIRPWANGLDITRRPRGMWIIDFPPGCSEAEAALYEAPFEYLRRNVRADRLRNARSVYAERWWIHGEPRPELRAATKGLARFLVTPAVAKHRPFVWLDPAFVPDQQLIAFARSDDYFLGVLQSRAHLAWVFRMGTRLESRPRYTPTSCFDTFPLPWPPGQEDTRSPLYGAIADAAHALNEHRERWLTGEGLPEDVLKKRTLTNLYNEHPTWLQLAHEKLDTAVLAAYGWPADLSDQEILARLLTLNLEREPA